MNDIIIAIINKISPDWVVFFLILLFFFKIALAEAKKAFNCLHKIYLNYLAKELAREKRYTDIINKYNQVVNKNNELIQKFINIDNRSK